MEDDDDGYTTAEEGGSPPEGEDSGHLTAAGGGGSRRGSGRGDAPSSPTQQQQQQQQRREGGDRQQEEGEDGEDGEEGGRPSGSRGWNILGGVPFLPSIVQLLSPKGTSGDEVGGEGAPAGAYPPPSEQQQQQQTPTSPGGTTSHFPAVAEQQPQADDADLQVGAGLLGLHLVLLSGLCLLLMPGQHGWWRRQPLLPSTPAPLPCSAPLPPCPTLQGTTTAPAPLQPGQQPLPAMSEPSTLMSEEHVRSVAAAVPARYRQARWTLLYATARDGISLTTLLRAAHRRAPTVLVVRDFDRWAVEGRQEPVGR